MNSYGRFFKVHIFGESHQDSVGVMIDGVTPGIKIDLDELKTDLDKRKPQAVGTTSRVESDEPIIVSGIFNDYTTGSPIVVMFNNKNKVSKDYEYLLNHPRPSHADLVSKFKYFGYNDYRGGGRFSGRVTIGLVAAGYFAKKMIPFLINSKLTQVGSLVDLTKLDDYLNEIIRENDSVGGIIEVKVSNMIIGIGEPFFDSLESEISKMMFSIPGVKGIEFGDVFKKYKGSDYNDLIIDKLGKTKTNNSGGINGGISNGNDLEFKITMRPTASIKKPQETINLSTNKIEKLEIKGRHDCCFARRCNIIVENATAIVLADLYLQYLANVKMHEELLKK